MTLSEADIERILAAARTIEESLEILAGYRSMERNEYKHDSAVQDIVERRFVKLTEAALDIARTLIIHERESVPDSNPGTMRSLVDENIMSEETGDAMVQAARFRNVLAHTYGDSIDDDTVYDALQDLQRYREFLGEIQAYLRDIEALDS